MTNISLLTFQPGLSTPDQACPRGRLWLWCRGNDNLTISSPGVHQLCDLCDEDSEWHLQVERSILREQYEFILSVKCFSICQLLQSFKSGPCVYFLNVIPRVSSWLTGMFMSDPHEPEYPGDHTLCSHFVPISPLSPSYRSQQQRWALSQFLAFCFRGKLGFFPPPPIPEFWWEVFID